MSKYYAKYPLSQPKPLDDWWVCDCCLFAREGDGDGCDGNGGCAGKPWARLIAGQAESRDSGHEYTVTYGLLAEEHSCGWDGGPKDDCDCERRDFVTRSCDGCGSPEHGTRHAYTLWFEQKN